MPSLLVFIFITELIVQIVNNFSTTIDALLWRLYLQLPTELAQNTAKQRKLQAEYLKCRKELHSTSSQDEFAKWAKLRRQHDKMLAELETHKSTINTTKSGFDQKLQAVRWTATRGLQQLITFWFRKHAVLWLPAGWFPNWAEWLVSWPAAPLGSVSVVMWSWACAGFFSLLIDTTRAVRDLVMARSTTHQKESIAVPVTGTAAGEGAKKTQ